MENICRFLLRNARVRITANDFPLAPFVNERVCLRLTELSSTYTPALFSFSPFNHLLVLQQSDIAIMSGASVLDGSIGFGPSGLL